jgi:hypothetical protein
MQQGCRYKHEMPDLETLRVIGFQSVPPWYQEKMSMSAVRTLRPNLEFRHMIESGPSAPSDSSVSDSQVDSEASVPPSPATHHSRPLASKLFPLISIIDEQIMECVGPVERMPPKSYFDVSKLEGIDPLEQDAHVYLNDPINRSIPLCEPQSSPESLAFCKGRFIPAGEKVPSLASFQVFPKSIPSEQTVPCLSPLHLGSPQISPAFTGLPSSRVFSTAKSDPPQAKHSFELQSEVAKPVIKQASVGTTSLSQPS